jgi:hypothetical protein
MNLSSQIATAGRRQVAEDGPDTCNSDSDSDTEQHGEVILDGYVGVKTDSNSNPIGSEHKITNEQAEAQRRAAQSTALRFEKGTSGKGHGGGGAPGGNSSEKGRAKSANRSETSQTPTSRPEGSNTMSTRGKSKTTQEEGIAGGARVTTGSWKKDTRAAKSRPSKT